MARKKSKAFMIAQFKNIKKEETIYTKKDKRKLLKIIRMSWQIMK